MKASDFRINNWVLDAQGEFVQIHSITISSGSRKLIINNEPAKLFSPIPLTTELLEFCGFEEKISTYNIVYSLNAFRLEHHPEGEGFILLNSDKIAKKHLTIKHLHALQNTYFTITNEVLPVKLKKQRA